MKKSGSLFDLDDIEFMAEKTPKKGTPSSSVPRSQPPTTRTKSIATKRKGLEASTASPFSDLDFMDAHSLMKQVASSFEFYWLVQDATS